MKKQAAYLCTTFERLKKFVELTSGCDWEMLSRHSQKEVTAGYIMHGDKTTVSVEPNGKLCIFELGSRKDVEYKIFVPESEKRRNDGTDEQSSKL